MARGDSIRKKKDRDYQARSGITIRDEGPTEKDEKYMNTDDMRKELYAVDHHVQARNDNYFAYTSGEVPLAASGTRYVYIRNNLGEDVTLYPADIVVLEKNLDLNIIIERNINPTITETPANALRSITHEDISVPLSPALYIEAVDVANIIDFGTHVPELDTYVFGDGRHSEEERGERYTLKAGQTLLGVIKNRVNQALTINVKSFWSYKDPLGE